MSLSELILVYEGPVEADTKKERIKPLILGISEQTDRIIEADDYIKSEDEMRDLLKEIQLQVFIGYQDIAQAKYYAFKKRFIQSVFDGRIKVDMHFCNIINNIYKNLGFKNTIDRAIDSVIVFHIESKKPSGGVKGYSYESIKAIDRDLLAKEYCNIVDTKV